MPGVMSQIVTKSDGVNCIFAKKGNWRKVLGGSFLLPQAVIIFSIKPISGSISSTTKTRKNGTHKGALLEVEMHPLGVLKSFQ